MEEEIKKENNDQKQLSSAIVIAGLIIAGAILLKGNMPANTAVVTDENNKPVVAIAPAQIIPEDRTIGNAGTKVSIILYEDFQCPFCGAVSGLAHDTDAIKYLQKIDPNWTAFTPGILEYANAGKIQYVYRDWAFLGAESVQSAEAAHCAGDQGKFWEYHDYLYAHQAGENKGAFSDKNLKSFAKTLGLNVKTFDSCLDNNKYAQAVADSKAEGVKAGVKGTPKGFILKNGKVVSTIDGAESWSTVKPKIDSALK